MKKLFGWLVRHEKLSAAFTLLLVVALIIQIQYMNRDVGGVANPPRPQTQAEKIEVAENSGAPSDVSGRWEMIVPQKNRTSVWTLTLAQDGEALKGVIKSEGGDLNVVGTIKGGSLNLTAQRFGVTVEFPADVDGEHMTGTMRVLHINRPWTAKRL
jgi:hypothetical protein